MCLCISILYDDDIRIWSYSKVHNKYNATLIWLPGREVALIKHLNSLNAVAEIQLEGKMGMPIILIWGWDLHKLLQLGGLYDAFQFEVRGSIIYLNLGGGGRGKNSSL